ncbi:N-acetyltransferase 10, partial [Bulinus truncatus]
IVILHHLLNKAKQTSNGTVLWCYKRELGFSSHTKKKIKQIQKKIKSGRLNVNEDDPFDLFISSTCIRFCHYSDSHSILGNTYGMCVLQDFEALTPNLLARTIETVEGGGLIIILLPTMSSLKQLMTMSMDVHSKFRTEAHQEIVGRFNERFVLSLGTCKSCIVVNNKLQLLPISSHALDIKLLSIKEQANQTEAEKRKIVHSISEKDVTSHKIIKLCKTVDQTQGFITFMEVLIEKRLSSTVVMTAGRGRGKSATLGLSLSLAIDLGYSNVFVTAPSPENLKTLFEFIFKGLDALSYKETIDYEIIHSTNPDYNKAVVRVNIFRRHRQTIQYIQPSDSHKLGQAELVCIDEAAAIPLPLVKNLLGPYLVFMSSTINGYEGTGRSLSLKLIHQLRQQCSTYNSSKGASVAKKFNDSTTQNRTLYEIELKESVRYANEDSIEAWLNNILCLEASITPWSISNCPLAADCHLYYVNRDTLFSYHPASEKFLQKIMALYVSSHYKNSPNDLHLLSDAPAHHIFVLLGPVRPNQADLPEPLCVLQVCLEGGISKSTVSKNLDRGMRASGDLIPWTISQQFQDYNFAGLSGARIVRIATHPEFQRMGYGTAALNQLQNYYEGQFSDLTESKVSSTKVKDNTEDNTDKETNLLNEVLEPRKKLPPLLVRLEDLPLERLDYLGVSFGLTSELFRFWKKSGFVPFYLRQTPNELTGEHSCIMLKEFNQSKTVQQVSLETFWKDFQRRFVSLLSYQFRSFKPSLALEILKNKGFKSTKAGSLSQTQMLTYLTQSDIQRLKLYSTNMVDYHMIVDLLPALSRLHFTGHIIVNLTLIESCIMLALGLQHKTVEDIERDIELPVSKILGLFKESICKFIKKFREIQGHNSGDISSCMKKCPTLTDQQLHTKSTKNELNCEGSDGSEICVKNQVQRKHKLSFDAEQTSCTELKKRNKHKNL